MKSLIIDLQQAALDDSVPVSTLLRKALLVATKLSQDDFKKWIESELDGYTDDVPEYRRARGRVMGWNMFSGWQLVQFEDKEIGDLISNRGTGQSAVELEALVSKEGYSSFHMTLPPGIQKMLGEGLGFETQYTVFTERASILGILGAIRTIILKWSLALEKAGVIGENMSFTESENQASGSVSQNITNYYAPVTYQTVGHGSATAIIVGAMDIDKIRVFIEKLAEKIDEIEGLEDKEELAQDISTIRAQTISKNPKWDKIRAALRSIGSALGKATSSIAAKELLEQLAELH